MGGIKASRIAAALIAVAFAGCTSTSTSTPPVVPATAGRTAASAPATFHISVPAASSSLRARPDYVSAQTAKVSVIVNGGAPVVAALSPASSNCAATGGGGFSCAVTVDAPIGMDSFVLSLLDSANHVLSTVTVPETVVLGSANQYALTLNGVIATLNATLSDTMPPADGMPHTITLTVTARDAAGQRIIAPGNFTQPISVLNTDTSGITTMKIGAAAPANPIVLNAPGVAITIVYSGAPLPAGATFTASTAGVTSAGTMLTPKGSSTGAQVLAAVGSSTTTVNTLPLSAGQPASVAVSQVSLALDSSNNLWYAHNDNTGIFKCPNTSGTFGACTKQFNYPPSGAGSASPVSPLAIDKNGNVYVGIVGTCSGGIVYVSGCVNVQRLTSSGAFSATVFEEPGGPSLMPGFVDGQYGTVQGIAIDENGNVAILTAKSPANFGGGVLYCQPSGATSYSCPDLSLSVFTGAFANPSFNYGPGGVALRSTYGLYVASVDSSLTKAYLAHCTQLAASPVCSITSLTRSTNAIGVGGAALDASGNFYYTYTDPTSFVYQMPVGSNTQSATTVPAGGSLSITP